MIILMKMKVKIMKAMIVAVDEECGIGRHGDIPWYYAEDMKFFSKTTRGGICIMGRKTYEDILDKVGNKEQLLPKRTSIVITSLPQTEVHGALAVKSFNEAMALAEPMGGDIFFTGGASIYRECLDFVDTVFITEIPGTHDCDVSISEVISEVMARYSLEEENQTETGLNFTKYTLV